MTGNTWDWTSSLYQPYPYDPKDGREKAEAEGRRVVRGGSWGGYQILARAPFRLHPHPGYRDSHWGLRVVCAAPIG